MTLNILCPSRLNPRLSAYAQMNVTFDYNRTPMPPPGKTTLVNDNPHNRGAWEPHGQEGWYDHQVMLHNFHLAVIEGHSRIWREEGDPPSGEVPSLSLDACPLAWRRPPA